MTISNPDHDIAFELSSKIDAAFGLCSCVMQKSLDDWTTLSVCESAKQVANAFVSAFPLRGNGQTFNVRDAKVDVWKSDSQLFAIVTPDAATGNDIVVGIRLEAQYEGLFHSLVSAHLDAIHYRTEALAAQKQAEFFVDQVTQDFEELTWLRSTNEYFDLCGNKHTVESIAKQCLPTLACVIHAENILFVPTVDDTQSNQPIPDWTRAIAAVPEDYDRQGLSLFLNDSLTHLVRGPRVFNKKFVNQHAPLSEFLRSGVALSVAKGPRTYGWIVAVNKRSPLERSSVESEAVSPSFFQFGTFEAGLLCAASNIMASHARNLELFAEQESLLSGIIRAIINAIDAKDPYTCGHSDRVAFYAKKIAFRLGEQPEECERIYMAGLLHDVGKIGVPDSILGKPGPLTQEEFAVVKKHPEMGYTILKHLKPLNYVLPGVLHHHEAVNGSGYPSGLVGEAIPLHGRILAVADAYDAMTSDRPYRKGMPSEKAEAILRSEAGKTWDSDIVGVFLECLATGEIRPHSIAAEASSNENQVVPNEPWDQNAALMQRIVNSINNLVVG